MEGQVVEGFLFYLFGGAMAFFTLATIFVRTPVYSAIFMILSFASTAGLFVLLDAYLIAIVQVLVYAGAIMVLFLFVIMLLNLSDPEELEKYTGMSLVGKRATIAGATALTLALVGVAGTGHGTEFVPNPVHAGGIDELNGLAAVLFSRYALPFEAASLLLLATMVGVITLAKRQRSSATNPDEAALQQSGEEASA